MCGINGIFRRLSIIDLSPAGAQPMTSADGKFTVTFNGEIYNYQALRRGLETRGFVFKSHSDTEVLLHLYAFKGAAMVGDLCGMFAFALWDAERRELFLARDPYGIKPRYYAHEDGTFRFASTVKALLAGARPRRRRRILFVRKRARTIHDVSIDTLASRGRHDNGQRRGGRRTQELFFHSRRPEGG